MNSNIEKTLHNSIVSVGAQCLAFLLQFINRRVFIIFLDIELLGYQTLFSNVFSLLSVTELGIGGAITFHLYREIVTHNEQEIGKLMYLYKQLYRIIAMVVLFGGLGCYFLLPYYVTRSTLSWSYLSLIYFLQLGSVVLGYFFSYRRAIYTTTQQEYKCAQIDLYVSIIVQVIQLILLALLHNYIIYLCLQLSTTLIANILITIRTNKEYPFLKLKYTVKKVDLVKRNIFSDIRNLFIHKIALAIYSGSDNIIISAFLGVRNVALYGNYVVVKNAVMNVFFYKLLNPLQATIGNIIYSEREKNELWNQFKTLDIFSFYFASYLGLGFLVFLQPFITLWMGEEYLLSNAFVALFALTIYLMSDLEIVYKYRSVFGDYRQDRNCMIASAVLNVAISVSAAPFFDIEGIQFGTLVAFLPIAYGRIRLVVESVFGQSLSRYISKHLLLLVIFMLEGACCFWFTNELPITVIGILIRILVWIIVPMVICSLIYFRSPHFTQLLVYLKSMISIVKSKLKHSNEQAENT